jgi:hypothetical protein
MKVFGNTNTLNRRDIVKNQELTPIQKADILLSDLTGGGDGGYLTAENAKAFLILMIKQARMLQDCHVIPMKSHTYNIDKLRFEDDILMVGTEATELSVTDRAQPTTTRDQIIAKGFKAQVDLNDYVLEDQIEGANFANTVQAAMSARLAADIEKCCLISDTASVTLPARHKQFDGLFALTASNVVDAGDANLNKDILRDMMRDMPSEYLDRTKLMIYTSVAADIDYRDAYANRQTTDGDSFLAEYKPVYYNGIPIKAVPLFPENVGTGTHCTNTMLMDPKNFCIGIWRRLRFETDKNIKSGVLSIVASIRFAAQLAQEEAVVMSENVRAIA